MWVYCRGKSRLPYPGLCRCLSGLSSSKRICRSAQRTPAPPAAMAQTRVKYLWKVFFAKSGPNSHVKPQKPLTVLSATSYAWRRSLPRSRIIEVVDKILAPPIPASCCHSRSGRDTAALQSLLYCCRSRGGRDTRLAAFAFLLSFRLWTKHSPRSLCLLLSFP